MNKPHLPTSAKLIAAALLSMHLAACVPVVAGGAVAGGVMAADRRTSGIYIEDQAIELKAKKMIVDNIGAANINVSVTSFNLNVLLTGEAISEEIRTKAERAALSVENVKTVTNELAISEKSGLGTSANDTYITSKVKSMMLKENRFPSNYVKVVTENSIVYLMGMVTREEGEEAVDIARSIGGVEKVVKVFEFIN
jgi:osmotically-inducible protein OsmY